MKPEKPWYVWTRLNLPVVQIYNNIQLLQILRQKLCPKRELKLNVEEAKQVKVKELKSVAMSQQTRKVSCGIWKF